MKNILLTKKQLAFAALALCLLLLIAFPAFARPLELTYPSLPNPGGGAPLTLSADMGLPQLLRYVFTFFVVIGGLIAFGMIVFAGFQFMISGANPGMRSQATNRIRSVIFGLVLLLSSYIIFNTINPELVILYTNRRSDFQQVLATPQSPGISSIIDTVDYATLRYGGVVVYEDAATTGVTGKSETILHDVAEETFQNATFMGANNIISAIKMIGNCEIEIRRPTASPTTLKPSNLPNNLGVFILSDTSFTGGTAFNNNLQKLSFTDKNCIGHSLRVFERLDFNRAAVTNQNGSLLLIANAFDLTKNRYVGSTRTPVAKSISSARLAFTNDGTTADVSLTPLGVTPIIKVRDAPLLLTFCDDKASKGQCITFSTTTAAFGRDWNFNDKTVSIQFKSGQYRQAGVTLYEDTDFEGNQEIFIASDSNLQHNFIRNDKTSSLQILGEYRVTLYVEQDFRSFPAPAPTDDVPFARGEHGWIQFDNTVEPPLLRANVKITPGGAFRQISGSISALTQARILAIPTMTYCYEYVNLDSQSGECRTTFNDRIKSIEMQIPVQVFERVFPGLNSAAYCGANDGDGDTANFCRL